MNSSNQNQAAANTEPANAPRQSSPAIDLAKAQPNSVLFQVATKIAGDQEGAGHDSFEYEGYRWFARWTTDPQCRDISESDWTLDLWGENCADGKTEVAFGVKAAPERFSSAGLTLRPDADTEDESDWDFLVEAFESPAARQAAGLL